MRKILILLLFLTLTTATAIAQIDLLEADTTDLPTHFSVGLMRLYAQYASTSHSAALPVQPMSDPYYSSTTYVPEGDMWGFKRIDAASAWAISKGAGVTVAVLDSGLDFFAGWGGEIFNNVWQNPAPVLVNGHYDTYGIDYCDPDHPGQAVGMDMVFSTTYDIQYSEPGPPLTFYNGGHGTLVSGIIAATENGHGINGMAPESKIMTMKVIGRGGDTTDIADAIRYAADHNVRIINMSLGVEPYSDGTNFMPQDLREAIDYAFGKGCILIAAAGNGGEDVQGWIPARDMKVLSVAATMPDSGNTAADFSNYGSEIDVAAPGVSIISLRAQGTDLYEGTSGYIKGSNIVGTNSEYYKASGTSVAAPFVSGIAALILSEYPDLSNDEVMNMIRFSAHDLGDLGLDPVYGYGLVNAYNALTTHFSGSYNLLDYMTDTIGDIAAYHNRKGAVSSTAMSQTTGIRTIGGIPTKVASYHKDVAGPNNDYTEYDYITVGEDGYRLYGADMDFEGDGVIDMSVANTGQVIGFADAGSGSVRVTALNHGLLNGNKVTIRNTANYNGEYTVTNVLPNAFDIIASWQGDDTAGEWAYYNIADSMGDIDSFADADGGMLTVTAPGHGLQNGDVIRIGNGLTGMGYISGITNVGSGQVAITDVAHGLESGDYVSIRGTTHYDGDYLVTSATADTFTITHSYVAPSGDDLYGYWSWYCPDPYNGQYTVTNVTTNTFQIEAPWQYTSVPASWTHYVTSALLCPGTLEQGRTYYAEVPFMNYGIKYNFSSAMTVNGTEDVTLESGVVVKNALKLTMETTIEDLDQIGIYSSDTLTSWNMKGLGEVKSVEDATATTAERNDLTAATTYYSTLGRKRSEFVGYKLSPQYVYYEYMNEADAFGLGHGRISKAGRADGSYDIFTAYYSGSNLVHYLTSYDPSGNLIATYEYQDGEIAKETLANSTVKYFDIGQTYSSTTDLDGSGSKDLIFSFGSSTGQGVWAYENNSTWKKIDYTDTTGVTLMTATDLDGNGKKDLLFNFGTSAGYWAYENNSTWKKIDYTDAAGVTFKAATDLDGNGSKDLLVSFGTAAGQGYWAYENNSTWKKIDYTDTTGITFKAATDLDGNGSKDLLFSFGTSAGQGFWAYENNSTWKQIQYTDTTGISLLASTDLDGNGSKDLIFDFGSTAGKGIWAYENNSTWKKIDYTDTTGVTLMASADLDGNGSKDLVFDFGASAGYWAYENNSTWKKIEYTDTTGVTLQAITDVDGNGKQDLIFNFGTSLGQGYWIFANNSTWMQVQYTDTTGVTLMAATDLDGNGKKDLVFDFGATAGYWAYENNSTWLKIPYTDASGLSLQAVTDLDGNGSKDLIFSFGTAAGQGYWAFENNSTWKKIDYTDTTGITMPQGDAETITRMNLESNLNPQTKGSNYVMVGEMVKKASDSGLVTTP